jgi:hypothetical protein
MFLTIAIVSFIAYLKKNILLQTDAHVCRSRPTLCFSPLLPLPPPKNEPPRYLRIKIFCDSMFAVDLYGSNHLITAIPDDSVERECFMITN